MKDRSHPPRRTQVIEQARQRCGAQLSAQDCADLESKILRRQARFLWISSRKAVHWLVAHEDVPLHVVCHEKPCRLVEVMGDGALIAEALRELVGAGGRSRAHVLSVLRSLCGQLGRSRLEREGIRQLLDGMRDFFDAEQADAIAPGRFGILPRQSPPDATDQQRQTNEPDLHQRPQKPAACYPERMFARSVGMSVNGWRDGIQQLERHGYVWTRPTGLGLLFVLFDQPVTSWDRRRRAAAATPGSTPRDGA